MEKIKQVSDYNFNWKSSALHHDKTIVRDIILAVLRQSLMDWNLVGDAPLIFQTCGRSNLYRAEIVGFFNSDWFGTMLDVYFPDYSQQSVCKAIKKKQKKYTPRELVPHDWKTRQKKLKEERNASI